MQPTKRRTRTNHNIQLGDVMDSNKYGSFTVLEIGRDKVGRKTLTIQFEKTGTVKEVQQSNAIQGNVKDDSLPKAKPSKRIKDRRLVREVDGVKTYQNNHQQEYQVLYREGRKVYIRYTTTFHETHITPDQHCNGQHRDCMQPSVYEVGIIGKGKYSCATHKRAYSTWLTMLGRKYRYSESTKTATRTTNIYKDWYCFQDFATWFEQNYFEGGCLTYLGDKTTASPDTVAIVPRSIWFGLIKRINPTTMRERLIPYHKSKRLDVETCRAVMALTF